jgi:hypothetical protein
MTYKGKAEITIGKYSNTDIAFIEIIDGVSGCHLVKVELSKAAFADALFGLGYVDAEMTYFEQCPVGQVREHKTIEIETSEFSIKDAEQVAALVKPFEVDGWKASTREAFQNHHRVKGSDGKYRHQVNFTRFLPREDAK